MEKFRSRKISNLSSEPTVKFLSSTYHNVGRVIADPSYESDLCLAPYCIIRFHWKSGYFRKKPTIYGSQWWFQQFSTAAGRCIQKIKRFLIKIVCTVTQTILDHFYAFSRKFSYPSAVSSALLHVLHLYCVYNEDGRIPAALLMMHSHMQLGVLKMIKPSQLGANMCRNSRFLF